MSPHPFLLTAQKVNFTIQVKAVYDVCLTEQSRAFLAIENILRK